MQPSDLEKLQAVKEGRASLRDVLTWPTTAKDEKYGYDEWFDGSVWRLKMYEDFFVQPSSMQSAVYQAARKRNLKVRTHIPTTDDCLYIQVIADE